MSQSDRRRWDEEVRARRQDDEDALSRREDEEELERRRRYDEDDLRRRLSEEESARRRRDHDASERSGQAVERRNDARWLRPDETYPRRAFPLPGRRRSIAPLGQGTWMLGLSFRELIMVWLVFLTILFVANMHHAA